MTFQPVHVDSRAALTRPNLLPSTRGAAAGRSAKSEGVSQSETAVPGVAAERLLHELRNEPVSRHAAIAAAKTDLATGRLLTKEAALETAAALMKEAIPD